MKEFAYKVLLILSLLTLLALGIDWMLEVSEVFAGFFGWPFERFQWRGLQSAEPWWIPYGIGVAAVLLPILTAASGVLSSRDNSIGTRTADGVIQLSPKAIEKLVKREVRQNIEEVLDVSAVARQGRRQAPAVRVNIAVTDSVPVPQVEARVKRETERVLNHLLGVADTNQIRIVVHDVSAVPARKRRKAERAAAAKTDRKREQKPLKVANEPNKLTVGKPE